MIWERQGRRDIGLLCKFMTFDTDWIHALLRLLPLPFPPTPFILRAGLNRWMPSSSHESRNNGNHSTHTKVKGNICPNRFQYLLAFSLSYKKKKKTLTFLFFIPKLWKMGSHKQKKVRVQQPTVWPISVSMMDRWLDKVSFCIYTSRLVRMKQGRRGPTWGKKM